MADDQNLDDEITGVHGNQGIGDDDKGGETNGEDSNATAALTAAIGEMSTNMQGFQGVVQGMNDRLARLEEGGSGDPDDDPNAGDDDSEDTNFDLMSNKELVGHIVGEIRKELGGVGERIDTNENNAIRERAATTVDRLSTKYDDFMDFKDQIRVELEGNSSLGIEQAYKLAKVNNPDKVTELAEEKKKDEPKEVEQSTYGGLMPTSGVTRKSSRMTQADAALEAWDDVFGGAGAS